MTKAALSTDGKTIMHSALSIRSSGMLLGISITSLTIIPQFSRRSVSFLSPAAKSGSATSASAIREEMIRLITVHLVVGFRARAIIECPHAGRNHRPRKRGLGKSVDSGVGSVNEEAPETESVAFRLYFSRTTWA